MTFPMFGGLQRHFVTYASTVHFGGTWGRLDEEVKVEGSETEVRRR